MLRTAVLCSLNAEMYSQLLLYHTVVFLSFSFHIISACSKQPEEKDGLKLSKINLPRIPL